MKKTIFMSLFIAIQAVFGISGIETPLFSQNETVIFPNAPKHITKMKNDLFQYDLFIAHENNMTFLAVVVPIEKTFNMQEASIALEGFMSGILHNETNKVDTVDIIQVSGKPALQFSIKNALKGFQGRTIMIDNHIVLLAVEFDNTDQKNLQIEQFINSFSLKK